MRVVAGDLRGRRLVAPEGQGTRPTSDKVRQAIFNSLDSAGLVRGARVADLFAGSGAMGIEALSRGADRCVFVENDGRARQALRHNVDALGLQARSEIVAADVLTRLPSLGPVDLAVADPPYRFDGWSELLAGLDATTVVAESDRDVDPPAGWEVLRTRRYGRTVVTIVSRIV